MNNRRHRQNRNDSQTFFNRTAVRTKVINRIALFKRGGIKL